MGRGQSKVADQFSGVFGERRGLESGQGALSSAPLNNAPPLGSFSQGDNQRFSLISFLEISPGASLSKVVNESGIFDGYQVEIRNAVCRDVLEWLIREDICERKQEVELEELPAGFWINKREQWPADILQSYLNWHYANNISQW